MDLLFDFISATVFGQGNMVLIQFFWVGFEFSSGTFRIYFLSFSCNGINVINQKQARLTKCTCA